MIRKCRNCGHWFLKKRNETAFRLGVSGVECPKCSTIDYYNDVYFLIEKFYDTIEKMLEKINHENSVKDCATHLSDDAWKVKEECMCVLKENDYSYEYEKKTLTKQKQE